jgi:hypothetical protein
MLPASSTDTPCTVPDSLDPDTSPQWDKYHANVSQRHLESAWSTEQGAPDESIQVAYNQLRAINA